MSQTIDGRIASSAVEHVAPGRRRSQARLPGQRDRVQRRGDAVGQQLRLRVAQRERRWEADAGPRLQLPLERVAMQVDQARQHQQPGRIDPHAGAARAECGDPPVSDRDGKLRLAAVLEQDGSVLNAELCP